MFYGPGITHVCGLTFAYNYINDLLIASMDAEECKCHFWTVFEHLHDHKILINLSKCELGIPQLQMLGHQIDSQGTPNAGQGAGSQGVVETNNSM